MKTSVIEIVKAEYISGYKVILYFSDNTHKNLDFKAFFDSVTNPAELRHKPIGKFKKFTIEDGNIVWGENWDIVFPIHELHKGIVRI